MEMILNLLIGGVEQGQKRTMKIRNFSCEAYEGLRKGEELLPRIVDSACSSQIRVLVPSPMLVQAKLHSGTTMILPVFRRVSNGSCEFRCGSFDREEKYAMIRKCLFVRSVC